MDHVSKQSKLTDSVSFVKASNEKVILLNAVTDASGNPRFKNFNPNKQTWQLFLQQIRGMLITGLFLGCFAAAVATYEKIKTVDSRGRLLFNTLSIAILLSLGLNFFSVIKDMAKVMRWRILSNHEFDVRQVDLILGSASLMNVLHLILENLHWSKPLILIMSVVWLALNITAQVSVGLLSLSAQLESGFNSDGITVAPGIVTVPKLDCFYRSGGGSCNAEDGYQPAIVHTYGATGILRDKSCRYNTTDDILSGRQTCPYFSRNDRPEFAHRYADLNPEDTTMAYPYFGAGRIITVSASNCVGYNMTVHGGAINTTNDTDGKDNVLVWRFANATTNMTLEVPRSSLAKTSTTYIWEDVKLPHKATAQSCGPRCVVVYALRDMVRNYFLSNGTKVQLPEWFMFQCHITVSPVSNTTNPAHQVNNSVARTVAASIALTGRWRMTKTHGAKDKDWRQYQLYQDGGEWAAGRDDSPEEVGARMAEFATAALGTMARRNPTVDIEGLRPTLGYKVIVDWKGIIAIAASIAATHALMIVLMLVLMRPVIVGDDSYLVLASLLRSVVPPSSEGQELDLLDDKKIAREIATSVGAKPSVMEEEGEELHPLLDGGGVNKTSVTERRTRWGARYLSPMDRNENDLGIVGGTRQMV
ncbi:MAG: hypothetical protein M1823_001398 [Watsoniomyces obsoletus]|nr:MAG: hypothetical protein M1823_001398 [Watsoniomyces obsoletus]